MSRRKHKKKATDEQKLNSIPETENKEDKEMTNEKVNVFVKIGRGIKGFFTEGFGKTATIVGAIAIGVTTAGVIIYKVFFSDGTEEITTSEGDLEDLDDETVSEVEEQVALAQNNTAE